VCERYLSLGARHCVPIYNAVDVDTHFPAPRSEPRFAADLSFLGNRLPDRERRVREFLIEPARAAPQRRFLLGGAGWEDIALPGNVSGLGHVPTIDHNAFNSSPLAVLNINRDSMAESGFSPPTRIFEAAAAGACVITDAWDGIDTFLAPGDEILVASTGREVLALLDRLTPERARAIGARARARMLAEHTYARRGAEVHQTLRDLQASKQKGRAA